MAPEEETPKSPSLSDEMMTDGDDRQVVLDCYPYTFTPLLLFAQESYFDRGYSNYNAVAQFFSSVMPVNMLENVVFEKKNMLYEDLYGHVTTNNSLIVCCIDSHFTACQVLQGKSCIYYDPLSSKLKFYSGDSSLVAILYLLLKCNYGDSQHVRDNKDHYTSGNATRRNIYDLWNRINTFKGISSTGVSPKKTVLLDAQKRYLLVNLKSNPELMSTQQTSNTCYFQSFLFGVLCKVGKLDWAKDRQRMRVVHMELLEETTAAMMDFLLRFFAPSPEKLRPLSNSNVVLDFYRYKESPYFMIATHYLQHLGRPVPNYEDQYHELLEYFRGQKCLHTYDRFSLDGAMSSSPNTKSLQGVCGAEDATSKLARSQYYKYKAATLMFGFNSHIMAGLDSFSEFNSLRKNQLLRYYEKLHEEFRGCPAAVAAKLTKYRDYYFMPQWEVGQQELVDVHYYTYLLDIFALTDLSADLAARVHGVNHRLVEDTFFSTQKTNNYEKMVKLEQFKRTRSFRQFLDGFMNTTFLFNHVALGFSDINPSEKEINSLTQTVFYTKDLMSMQMHRQSYDFEKECINQMARSTYRKYMRRFDDDPSYSQKYRVSIKIGHGYTYSKYNTLLHFINVMDCYWKNPDLSNIQVFGKDVRTLLCVASQKIFFDSQHSGFYHYGPFENTASHRNDLELAVASSLAEVSPYVTHKKKKNLNHLIVTDRVFEHGHLRTLLETVFTGAQGTRLKTDNDVLNLCLLSLMLDFKLYEDYSGLLNLPLLRCLEHHADTRELQVEVANLIYEFDRKNTSDSVTRGRVEELIFEMSYKFLVNKDFPVTSRQFKLIRLLNSDPDFQSYVLLCKVYMSLCQINKNVEMDYYKVHCDGKFRIIIPQNYSLKTSAYLDEVTNQYTFSEREGFMLYDDHPVFDLRPPQPEIHLHRIRLDSSTDIQSMVKYLEISNVFRVVGSAEQYLVFIADNALLIDVAASGNMTIQINEIEVEVATMFFDALSFIPCFKYADSNDAILFTSQSIEYKVDRGGQFATDYYGMKHELLECIRSDEVFVDLNDEHVFKSFQLSELLTESKTVLHYPDYLLQVPDRRHLIDLLDLSVKLRNVSFFILSLYFLCRTSVNIEYVAKEGRTTKISGPWLEAILYVLGKAKLNKHYDRIFGSQFFNLDQHADLSLDDFVDVICDNFTKYQRHTEDGQYEIVPRQSQKNFLKHIVTAGEPFHFSEVGSGKTKVVLPLLCQMFLSNNRAVHKSLSRGGKAKDTLVVLVPEHLLSDARTQVLRYCLNLNFRKDYKVYDEIFALLHDKVTLGRSKTIFVTSFNQFKKALTYDKICKKVQPHRENMLLVVDEVDDFLDRNKLVFNICSNKNNTFDIVTLELFFDISRAAYHQEQCPSVSNSNNPWYWEHLFDKFAAIFAEIQDASKSINKSFGVFNEQTLRHCTTNIVHDIEGYKSLIARPYESVNRAMPGSYYSDSERTIFLTYVILSEDIGKYNDLFQAERKFITFEFWNDFLPHQLDYDDLVYGHERLSEIVEKLPETREGLMRFLYSIILRRMEIRDKSRSVNSIDVVFNFDCIGFTGTPFLDNYPAFDYIRSGRQDEIPGMIDRSFYAYSTDDLSRDEFQARFSQFQGRNSNVRVTYQSSDFVTESPSEMSTLRSLFEKEDSGPDQLNAIVDLVGIFKLSTVHDIRNLILECFGQDRFDYIYHIDQRDTDRVMCIASENDAQYDEEFYKHMCKKYGHRLREKIFFFVDNRNVIGKDIPFQLVFQKHFGLPLFIKSLVLAHDVDDFSKIWQAMGRSRTMNETLFSIYKSGSSSGNGDAPAAKDIKQHELTRELYILNCDRKIAGNISSAYLTVIALFNLAKHSFYFTDKIVNTFLDKMERKLKSKVTDHSDELGRVVLGSPFISLIFYHIVSDKLKRSTNAALSGRRLEENSMDVLLRHIVDQKYELRKPSENWFDDLIVYLSGEQKSQMEISYTKQQQKQKQTQKNKNQDSDAMGTFDKKNQLTLSIDESDYFASTLISTKDRTKVSLNLPCHVPILSIEYSNSGQKHFINVYPTLQFLYSHFVQGHYMSEEVQNHFKGFSGDERKFHASFLHSVLSKRDGNQNSKENDSNFGLRVLRSFVRQNPQCSLAAIEPGVYIIGMKDQFNKFDLVNHPLQARIQFVTDEMGFILYDRTAARDVDAFGPYCIELYVLMEVISKQEVAQNVIENYRSNKEKLCRCLDFYQESQGKGFICWRFLMNEAYSNMALSGIKRPRTEDHLDDVTDGLARALDI